MVTLNGFISKQVMLVVQLNISHIEHSESYVIMEIQIEICSGVLNML